MSRTALLLMDLQPGILGRYGDVTDYLARLASTADAARAAGVPVIHVAVQFRDGHPEVSGRNQGFAAIAAAGGLLASAPAGQVCAEIARDDEVLVVKRRVSAFAGSDLDVVLRSMEIDHLVLAGVATGGVVVSTLRQAADLDFRLTVLSDGCLDMDPEVHRVLVEKLFPRQAEVVTAAEWVARTGLVARRLTRASARARTSPARSSPPVVDDRPVLAQPGTAATTCSVGAAPVRRCSTGRPWASTRTSAINRRWHRHQSTSLHISAMRSSSARASSVGDGCAELRGSGVRRVATERRDLPPRVGGVRRGAPAACRAVRPTGRRCPRRATTTRARRCRRPGCDGYRGTGGRPGPRRPRSRAAAPRSRGVRACCART